jgi:hypothetical protein
LPSVVAITVALAPWLLIRSVARAGSLAGSSAHSLDNSHSVAYATARILINVLRETMVTLLLASH